MPTPLAAPPEDSLNHAAHAIQLALTPVFLLTGVGTLLNVFSGRLARVADQAQATSLQLEAATTEEARAAAQHRLRQLNARSLLMDVAVTLAATGGVATAISVLTLFVGSFRGVGAPLLLWSFGAGVVCTVLALGAYLAESLIANGSVRRIMRHAERRRRVEP